jgi:hypothetical protein
LQHESILTTPLTSCSTTKFLQHHSLLATPINSYNTTHFLRHHSLFAAPLTSYNTNQFLQHTHFLQHHSLLPTRINSSITNQFFAPMNVLPNQFFTRMNLLHHSILYTNESSTPFNSLHEWIFCTNQFFTRMNLLHQSILCNQWFAPINSSQSVLCTNESSVKPILCTDQLSWFDPSNFETDKYQFMSPILFVIPLVTTVLISEKSESTIHLRSNMLTFWSPHWLIDQSDWSLKVLPWKIHHDVLDGFLFNIRDWSAGICLIAWWEYILRIWFRCLSFWE